MSTIDFRAFAQDLNSRAETLLAEWLPAGRLIGREYVCGSIQNEPGDSFRFNVDKCVGKDFATGQGFSDMLDLYCQIHGFRPIEAYKQLTAGVPMKLPTPIQNTTPPVLPANDIVPPPVGEQFTGQHYTHGYPASIYTYTDEAGVILFYVCRYDTTKGKQFAPWCWSESRRKYVAKAWPGKRPLFNLHKISAYPERRIVVVEGEKAALALEKIIPEPYIVTTWSGGASAFNKTDLKPLHGRHVILWPDADDAGRKAMADIASQLVTQTASLKIIDTEGLGDGFDAADLPDGTKFYDWARPRAKLIEPPKAEEIAQVVNQNLHIHVNETEPEPPRSLYALWDEAGIVLKGNQKTPDCNAETVLKIMFFDDFFKKSMWFDTFLKQSQTPRGQMTEADEIRTLVYLQSKYGLSKLTKSTVQDAIAVFLEENQQNHLTDWLESLTHDGTFRIDDFLTRAMGVEKTPYTQAVSRNFWLSLIARAFRPGCKVDEMVILEGRQGSLKSTALETIGGPYYAKVSSNLDSKDFVQGLRGRWLMEMDELDRFSKADVTTVKQILSTATDHYRESYGRYTKSHPRTCIFVGTTNEENYLKDPTGNRRFWPIKVTECDVKYIEENRDQLMAEAVMRFKAGERWHEVPWEDAEAVRASRHVVDEWEADILRYAEGRLYFSIKEFLEFMGLSFKDIGSNQTMRVASVLKRHGWESRKCFIDGNQARAWVPKGSAQTAFRSQVINAALRP